MKDLNNSIRGSLIGGAVGDALGYAVEFTLYNKIISQYGEPGITRFNLDAAGKARVSDDTQMTLYTANGLINAGPDASIQTMLTCIRDAYLEWLKTQKNTDKMIENPECWISTEKSMYSRRAPGNTCMSALHTIASGNDPDNYSKGCGGIMRVAPIALFGAAHNLDIQSMTMLGCLSSWMTHLHPMGFLPSGLMVYVLQSILQTEEPVTIDTLEKFVKDGITVLEESVSRRNGVPFKKTYQGPLKELHDKSLEALNMARGTESDYKCVTKLGEGWVGEEAWYIALFCCARHINDFEKAVIAAVNHSGDSDSTGAICGNLVGAIVGNDNIPKYYKENLELRYQILKMADMLEGKTDDDAD